MGRETPCPRLSAWVGDRGARYSYSGLALEPAPWTPALIEVRDRVRALTGLESNSVLLNLYRDGADSMGWHADDEPELGPDPVIASVSFGATRRFILKHRARRDLDPIALELAEGSLLVMSGPTQRFWKHRIAKTRKPVGERINLTFRRIVVAAGSA